jgi:hypothetical protein
MAGKLSGAIALTATCALLTACSQNAADQSRTTVSQPVASSSRVPATPAPVSTSPIPPNADSYATPLEAGIAGIEAKTGLPYTGGACSSFQSCLGTAHAFGEVFGNTEYVTIQHSTSGAQDCFAYVFVASGGWHYSQPVVCPQYLGYNPAYGVEDHVAVPGSCANVRLGPGLSQKVLECLKDGTIVTIDSEFPRYVDQHIWWSINGHYGWMAHDFLITDLS